MEYVLVQAEYCWADEFEVQGFDVYTKEDFENSKLIVQNYFKDNKWLEIGFGTNEDIEFGNAEDVFRGLSITALTEVEAKVIETTIGSSYGLFPYSRILECIDSCYDDFDEFSEGEE